MSDISHIGGSGFPRKRVRDSVDKLPESSRSLRFHRPVTFGPISSILQETRRTLETAVHKDGLIPLDLAQKNNGTAVSSAFLNGNGTDNGQDGGNGKPPENPLLPPTRLIASVRELLEKHNYFVDTPHLVDGSQQQGRFLEKNWGDNAKARLIYHLRETGLLANADSPLSWYEVLAQFGLYDAGVIHDSNLATLLRRPSPVDVLYHQNAAGVIQESNITEMGIGDGKIIRRLSELKIASAGILEAAQGMKGSRPNKSTIRSILDAIQRGVGKISSGTVDETLTGLDFAQSFVDKIRKDNINGVQVDVCLPTEEFLRVTRIQPKSQKIIICNLLMDRIPDLVQWVTNMRAIAADNAQFFIGVIFPFSGKSDSNSKTKVPENLFYKSESDIRKLFEGEDFDTALFNMIKTLNNLGLVTLTMGQQPYYVLSPHCVVDTVKNIRENYAEHLTRDYHDPVVNELVRKIREGELPDHLVVGLPQCYAGDNGLVMLGGNILPHTAAERKKHRY